MVDERTRDIQAQARELKEVNASKDKFFRIIAHDLRSPLSGFLKLTDLMANQSNNISVTEYAEISSSLNKSADNLYKLMNNLLEWATIQQSGIKINKELLNLNELINQNIATITDRLTQKKVSILNSVNPNLEIFADEKMINTVFRNLLSNAIKFTKQGDKITIDAEDNGNEIHIIVSDTGIGISEGELIKLFKIDEKVSRKGTDNEPSTGLGLVLCKEFMDIHGGKIWAESEEYNWSKFHITIPKA
jgi:signal transduction histidine kinase